MTTTFAPKVHFVIHEYSHGFEVRNVDVLACEFVGGFANRFIVKSMNTQPINRNGHYTRPKADNPDKYYPSFCPGVFYRFHIGCLQEFIEIMQDRGYHSNSYDHIKYGFPDIPDIEFSTAANKEVRPQQQEAIDFVLKSDPNGVRSRLLQMPTGTGKTFTSLKIASILKKKFAVHISGQYMDKWIGDIQSNTDITREEIYPVIGGSSLMKLMHSSAEDLKDIKAFIFSTETLGVFYRGYLGNEGSIEDTPYPFPPEMLHGHIQVGFAIFDEIHEKLVQVYKILSYSHIPMVLGLSGTFISSQNDVLEMQKLMFPISARYDKLKMNKYINVYPVAYSFENFDKLNVQYRIRGSTMYNHNSFEQWLLNRPKILKNYMSMLGYVMHHMFKGDNDDFVNGDRAIVFVSSVDLATRATEYFKEHYPTLDVRRYIGEDPYENVIDPDVRITTPQSAGAAIDIPKLTMALMSVNVQSPVTNKQAIGRLREIEGKKISFVYLYCSQIPAHKAYHEYRKKLFWPDTASIQELVMPFQL